MTDFDFTPLKAQVRSAVDTDYDLRFFETYDKQDHPHLLVFSREVIPPKNRIASEKAYLRYYHHEGNILSLVAQFFGFIKEGLNFAYVDDLNRIHLFVDPVFMSRAYGCKHNNIIFFTDILDQRLHIYPSSQEYRLQIKQSLVNSLFLTDLTRQNFENSQIAASTFVIPRMKS